MLKDIMDAARQAIEDTLRRRPDWVSMTLEPGEPYLLAREIIRRRATSAIEIGVASGFSSAIIWAALKQSTDHPRLYAFDRSEKLYYDGSRISGDLTDKHRKTGEAFHEIHGRQPGFLLTTGDISAGIDVPEKVDFVFIDADHSAPWPTVDLLSASRFLAPKAVIALDDIDMILNYRWKDKSGARDLYRCWFGKKWRYAKQPNIGFLRFDGLSPLAASLRAAILPDWDSDLPELERYIAITSHLPLWRRLNFVRALRARSRSREKLR